MARDKRRKQPRARRQPANPVSASPEQARRLEQAERRKRRGSRLTIVLIIGLIGLVTALAISLVLSRSSTRPVLQFIYSGRIETTSDTNALIIRDERLLSGGSTGTVRPAVADGTHVSTGQEIAMVVSPDLDPILYEIQSYEEQIASLQLELISEGKGSGASQIYQETDEQLRPLISQLRLNSAGGQIGGNRALQDSVEVLLDERQDRLRRVDFNDAMLTQLQQELERLSQQLSANAYMLSAPQAGLISFRSDGLEDVLTTESVEQLTPGLVEAYLDQSSGMNALAVEAGPNEPLARQVLGVWQYMAMTFDNVPAGWFEENPVFTLRARDQGVDIENCQVLQVSEEGAGSFVVIRTDSRLDRLLGERSTSVRLATSSVSGLKVPVSTLYNDNQSGSEADIMQVSGGYARGVRVRVIARDAANAIIEPVDEAAALQEGSVIVTNPDSIEEGSAING